MTIPFLTYNFWYSSRVKILAFSLQTAPHNIIYSSWKDIRHACVLYRTLECIENIKKFDNHWNPGTHVVCTIPLKATLPEHVSCTSSLRYKHSTRSTDSVNVILWSKTSPWSVILGEGHQHEARLDFSVSTANIIIPRILIGKPQRHTVSTSSSPCNIQ